MSALERIQLMMSNPIAYRTMAKAEASGIDSRVKTQHDRSCNIWEIWTERHTIEGERVVVKFEGCRKCRTAIQR